MPPADVSGVGQAQIDPQGCAESIFAEGPNREGAHADGHQLKETSTVSLVEAVFASELATEGAVLIRRDLRSDQEGGKTNDIYLEPFDIVFVPKTPLATVGEFMEQLLGVLPPLKNSAFGFVYQLNNVSGTTVFRQ